MLKKSVILFILFSVVFTFSLISAEKEEHGLTLEYKKLNQEFKKTLESAESYEAFQKFKQEKDQKLEELLAKAEAGKESDETNLLIGKIYLDQKKFEEANKKLTQLIASNSPMKLQAQFQSVKVMIMQRDSARALELFREIEEKVEKNEDYLMFLTAFAHTAKTYEEKKAYSNKFLKHAGNDPKIMPHKAMIYSNLANLEKEKGNLKGAITILKDAEGKFSDKQSKKMIQSTLNRFQLYNSKAPEIIVENWLNSNPLKLEGLKGKAVLIDFWATWCGPCRKGIPILVESYNKFKEKGLVVIGFTRIYGSYIDDKINKEKITKEEELKLLDEFSKRFKISYPIAIADGGETFDTYGVLGIPTMYLIDKNGVINDIVVGSGDDEGLVKKIEALLK